MNQIRIPLTKEEALARKAVSLVEIPVGLLPEDTPASELPIERWRTWGHERQWEINFRAWGRVGGELGFLMEELSVQRGTFMEALEVVGRFAREHKDV